MPSARAARGALWGVTIVLWLGLGRLGLAFARSELSFEYVAKHSRADAPWLYRVAGVWGGSEGSLLLLCAVLAAVACLGGRGLRGPAALWFASGSIGVLAVVGVAVASPFRRLPAPAVRGFGLTPILEHPAMAIHPPLLYGGLACSLVAAMAAVDGAAVRPWLRATLGLTTAAMALGGAWSYVEQGWGGYWAWDPVENTSLLVWLAALVAVHVEHPRWTAVMPWLLTLAGGALVRSGATPSVHGFAAEAAVGWLFVAVALLSGVGLWRLLAPGRAPLPAASHGMAWARTIRLAPVVAGGAALLVVAAGTVYPVLADATGERPGAVRGEFYARLLAPVALVAAPFLVRRLRGRNARTAHAGMLVLCLGVAATTFDRQETVLVGDGVTVRAVGLDVTGRGVAVEDGPRFDVQRVVAHLEVNGVAMSPALVAYPEHGGVLAETAVDPGLLEDLQVTLLDADDRGVARIEVRRRPLMWLVWLGAVLTATGALTASRRARRRSVDEPASGPATR